MWPSSWDSSSDGTYTATADMSRTEFQGTRISMYMYVCIVFLTRYRIYSQGTYGRCVLEMGGLVISFPLDMMVAYLSVPPSSRTIPPRPLPLHRLPHTHLLYHTHLRCCRWHGLRLFPPKLVNPLHNRQSNLHTSRPLRRLQRLIRCMWCRSVRQRQVMWW